MHIIWLRTAAALYAVGLLDAILTVLRRRSQLFPYALGAFIAAAILHFVAIVELSVAESHLAANNFFQTASLCAFLIAAVYLVVYWRLRFASLSVFLFPLVFVLTLMGSMGQPVATWGDSRVRNAWLLTHIVLVLIGYAGLLLAAGGAVFYLLAERRLKRKIPTQLPPLETLDALITRSMSIGFVAVTLAVIAGSTYAFIETGTRWISEPKIAVSIFTWMFYLLMVFLRVSAGWRGRRAAVLALTVVGFGALTWAAHVGLRPLLQK